MERLSRDAWFVHARLIIPRHVRRPSGDGLEHLPGQVSQELQPAQTRAIDASSDSAVVGAAIRGGYATVVDQMDGAGRTVSVFYAGRLVWGQVRFDDPFAVRDSDAVAVDLHDRQSAPQLSLAAGTVGLQRPAHQNSQTRRHGHGPYRGDGLVLLLDGFCRNLVATWAAALAECADLKDTRPFAVRQCPVWQKREWPSGGIGRRTGFKILCPLWACGFKSRLGY